MLNGVFLGFDFGCKRIGVAVGQKLTNSASPLPTLKATEGGPSWNSIAQYVRAWQPEGLVVGLPTTIDGHEQYTTVMVREFADKLGQYTQLPIYLTDERLSTKEARARLFADGGYRKIRQSEIDSIAACVILEQWLSTHHSTA